MKTVKVQYDAVTGKISGYYPSDVEYSEAIKPYIILTEKEFSSVLGNESAYRIQDKKLINISDTAEYKIEENEKLLKLASAKISEQAAYASSYGVIIVDETYYVNVSWKEYYEYFLSLLQTQPRTIGLKLYEISKTNEYFIVYKEFESDAAISLMKKIVSAIDDYRNNYIPNKQEEYVKELKRIQDSGSLAGIKSFYEGINYGLVLNESLNPTKIKVSD